MRPDRVELIRRDYTANGGWETFLSYEDPEKDILVGLLRLRKCSDEGTFRPELVRRPCEDGEEEGGTVSIVRELHVYGTAVPVHGRDPTKFQHQVSMTRLVDLSLMHMWLVSGIRDVVDGRGRAHRQRRAWKCQACRHIWRWNQGLLSAAWLCARWAVHVEISNMKVGFNLTFPSVLRESGILLNFISPSQIR